MTPPAAPIGALPLGDDRWRFVLWAPSADEVTLVLEAGRRRLAMAPLGVDHPGATAAPGTAGVGGYWTTTVDDLPEGTLYRFALDDGEPLPDPASRWQPQGVHGPSALFDPGRFTWDDAAFGSPPLERSVLYELHVGTFSPAGTLGGVADELDHLVELGITTVELMPLAQFPGTRNWGYDGVFPYAVQHSYGGPRALQELVAACHRRGLAVCLDVVYNHFGPEGNVLPRFGPYTTDRYRTPWGPAINVDGRGADDVRRYLVHNALQWFADFHVDMLRLDAVHGIVDRSPHRFLQQLAEATAALAASTGRRLLLVAESADNDPRLVRGPAEGGPGLDGQWSDDLHHALWTVVTGERRSYYRDFGQLSQLARALQEGFVFRGQYSTALGRAHGSPSPAPRPERFVVYDQNHDQVGNRPRGERLGSLVPPAAVRFASAVILVAPGVPMLFMGEEYGETAPFPYFVDHGEPDLVEAVRKGRAEEMGELWAVEPLDPADPSTFDAARLDLSRVRSGDGARLLAHYRRWVARRRHHGALAPGGTTAATTAGAVLSVVRLGPGAGRPRAGLALVANAGPEPTAAEPPEAPAGHRWAVVETSDAAVPDAAVAGTTVPDAAVPETVVSGATVPGAGAGPGHPGPFALGPWGYVVLDLRPVADEAPGAAEVA